LYIGFKKKAVKHALMPLLDDRQNYLQHLFVYVVVLYGHLVDNMSLILIHLLSLLLIVLVMVLHRKKVNIVQ